MTDYCECGLRASRLCKNCKSPTCLTHDSFSYDVTLAPQFERSFEALLVGRERCERCAEELASSLVTSSEFVQYANMPSIFETACAVLSWDSCLNGYLSYHTPGSTCCPPHWVMDKQKTVRPVLGSHSDVQFTARSDATGPHLDQLTLNTFVGEYLQSLARWGISPESSVKLGRRKSSPAFTVLGKFLLTVDGTIYPYNFTGVADNPLPERAMETVLHTRANSVLRTEGKGRNDTLLIDANDLLRFAHYALRRLPMPEHVETR